MDANTISYFNTLYNKCGDMFVCIWSQQANNFISAKNVSASAGGIISGRETNWFHSFQPLRHTPARGRGTSADVGAIVGAFLDVDVGFEAEGSKYAAGKNPELTLAELKALFVEWGYPAPSAIVHTGNGFHFEWRLDEPYVLAGLEERKRAVAFLKGFNQRAIQLGKEKGLKFDNMSDLARLKRAVGSTNVKEPGNPKAVKLIELDPKVLYSLEQLEAVAPPAVSQSAVRKAAQPQGGFDDHKRPNWQGIVAGCAFAQHLEASAELTEPEWQSAASLRREDLDRLRKTLHEAELAYLRTKEEEEQEVADLELFQGSAVARRKSKSGELVLPSDSLKKLDRLRAQMIEQRATAEVARENLETALAEDPSARRGFKTHEQWLDRLRIYPPGIAAVAAWVTVLTLTLWPLVRPH